MNYEFDKAIEKFEFFGNFILETNWEDKNLNKRK